MAKEIKLPVLAEGVDSAEVLEVLVAPGDAIEEDQTILEVQTDKAAAEVPSTVSGTVKEVLVKTGDVVAVGQTLITVDESGASEEKGEAPVEDGKSESEAAPAAEEKVEESKSESTADDAAKPSAPKEKASGATGGSVSAVVKTETLAPAAPSVRRFAREIGIDIDQVPGSGAHGRVSLDDVKGYAKQRNEGGGGGAAGVGVAVPTLPDFSAHGPVRREAMNNMQRRTAENMVLSATVIPHVTQCDDADITALEALRKRFGKRAEAAGGKLTMTAMLVKIVAAALKKYPAFNASVDMEKAEVVYKSFYNIGVAVDTPMGLLVPVIKDVDGKNMIDISVEMTEMSKRARDGKTKLKELEGGSITITNVGGIGGTYFTPIVNYPEVAILGVGRAKEQAVRVGDGWESRLILPLSLSYDHRLINGADGIRFLRWIIDAMEEPLLLSLEG